MRLISLWYFLCAALLYALFRLLFDNILYAAIMSRLHSSFGIEERDVVALVAANLIPIMATIAVLVIIYRVSLRHHTARATTSNNISDPLPPLPRRGVRRNLGVLIAKLEPLPAIALGLAVTFVGSLIYEAYYSQTPRQRPAISDTDRQNIISATTQVITAMTLMQSGAKMGLELLDNWQYKIQTNGADDFMRQLVPIENIFYSGMARLVDTKKTFQGIRQIMPLVKTDDAPPCFVKTAEFYAEIKRLQEHKADLVFTLVNDTKFADWRAVLPECKSWIEKRLDAADKVIAEYQTGVEK